MLLLLLSVVVVAVVAVVRLLLSSVVVDVIAVFGCRQKKGISFIASKIMFTQTVLTTVFSRSSFFVPIDDPTEQ